jgi:hypothetical protein
VIDRSSDPLENLRFWMQTFEDSRRTLLCPPDLESRVKGYVDAHGLGGVVQVKASPIIPDGQVMIVDENALEAEWRQTLQRNRWI